MKKYTQLVIIRYPASGETLAYRKDDPDLIDTLIDLCNIEYDDTVICAELEEDVVIEPRQNQTREIIESDENPRYDTSIYTGEHLRHHRKKWNLSQTHLADQIGVTCTTISRWEQGHMDISKKSRVLLNDFFNKLYNPKQETKNNE
jgi:DNA-binding transcriptional regulator YiaG